MSVDAPHHGEKMKTHGGVQWDTVERETQMVCPLSRKKIFRKGVDLGLLANAGADTTAHGITGIDVDGVEAVVVESRTAEGFEALSRDHLLGCVRRARGRSRTPVRTTPPGRGLFP